MVCPLCNKILFEDGTHQIISSCNYYGSVMTREEILRACESSALNHIVEQHSGANIEDK